MICPRCGRPTRVTESRTSGTFMRRRRVCGLGKAGSCGLRFTTVELPAGYSVDMSVVVGPSGLAIEVKKK